MKSSEPLRGEVWLADLKPVKGHEQGEKRPVLIISSDVMNTGPAELVVAVPITSKKKGIASHIAVAPPDGGLTMASFVICEQVRCIAKERLGKKLGELSPQAIAKVELALRAILDLSI